MNIKHLQKYVKDYVMRWWVGACKDKDPPIRYRKLVVDAGMMFNFPSNYMKRLSLA